MTIAQRVYNHVLRPHLPRKWAWCNGVWTRSTKLLDATDEIPDYEAALVDAIRDHVDNGFRVGLIGGGYGCSTVHCARAGAVSVDVFEAASERVADVRKAVELNDTGDTEITVHHARVGPAIDVWGTAHSAARGDQFWTTEYDVVVLDCEGAEVEITSRGLEADIVIIETHDSLEAVRTQLKNYRFSEPVDCGSEAGMWDDVSVVVGFRRGEGVSDD